MSAKQSKCSSKRAKYTVNIGIGGLNKVNVWVWELNKR